MQNGNLKVKQPLFLWYRGMESRPISVFTNQSIPQILNYSDSPVNYALLTEPSAIDPRSYEIARALAGNFTKVLSFEKGFVDQIPNGQLYLYGGTWIEEKDWKVYPKTRKVSFLASIKAFTEGHQLRQDIRVRYGSKIDLIAGRGFNPINYKLDTLRDFRYSIVVENCKKEHYFSEKLIDCFLTGTIPIYWGCPSINTFFDPKGIIQFQTIEELNGILEGLSETDYSGRGDALENNFLIARHYTVTENWLYQNVFSNMTGKKITQ
jgi:hypothetical protein